METLNHLVLATDLEYITEKEVAVSRPSIEELANKLNKLRKVQLIKK